MFPCSRVTDLVRNNGAPLLVGIALGILGAYIVRWLKNNISKNHSPESFPTSFHIIHLKKGEAPLVKSVRHDEFTGIATPEKLNALRSSVGWGERTAKIWQGVFEKSAHLVCAIQDKTLLAYGCVVGNGRMGLITDIHVHPDHQRQGIGTHIMNDIVEYLKPREYAFLGLFGWEGNQSVLKFYEKFGFKQTQFGMETSSSKLTNELRLLT